jgi:hypothetical protein
MSQPFRPAAARPLPAWLLAVGSLVLLFHFFAIVILVLAAPSGPWPTGMGVNMAQPPTFAQSAEAYTSPYYLWFLKMYSTYHFQSNRPAYPGVYFEVVLKNDAGKVIKTVKFPEDDANFWVKHRQVLLARNLADDQPVEPTPGEKIAAPNRHVNMVPIWLMKPGDSGVSIQSVEEHKIRDYVERGPVFRPSELSKIVAHSYIRALCRKYDAASGELIRYSRDPIGPDVLMGDSIPDQLFGEFRANFGETKRETKP